MEATRACLSGSRAVDRKVHAFLHVDERARWPPPRPSDAAPRARASPLGPLDGVPVALKDIFLTEGLQTTCGSKILEGFVPPYDATVVRLLQQAGLPILGKPNHGRVRDGLVHRELARSARRTIRGT